MKRGECIEGKWETRRKVGEKELEKRESRRGNQEEDNGKNKVRIKKQVRDGETEKGREGEKESYDLVITQS